MGQRGACAQKRLFDVHRHFSLTCCSRCSYGVPSGSAVSWLSALKREEVCWIASALLPVAYGDSWRPDSAVAPTKIFVWPGGVNSGIACIQGPISSILGKMIWSRTAVATVLSKGSSGIRLASGAQARIRL